MLDHSIGSLRDLNSIKFHWEVQAISRFNYWISPSLKFILTYWALQNLKCWIGSWENCYAFNLQDYHTSSGATSPDYILGVMKSFMIYHVIVGGCYRCLGPPTFFCSPTLSAVPLSVGHDNQQWRDLLRDLEPICRWWCSKHCLLKAESITSFSFCFLFISDLFMLSLAWLHHISPSCHHAYVFVSARLTHPLSLVIMLTLICYSCLLL